MRTLELNPPHPILWRADTRGTPGRGRPELALYADLLYGQALLAEGRRCRTRRRSAGGSRS
jgi:HSP90 family molecular chaperone